MRGIMSAWAERAARRGARRLAAVAAVLLSGIGAAALAGCDSGDDGDVLRLAINPWPGYEFLYLARERGYLAEEGLKVDFVERPDLGGVRAAFVAGEADAMTVTLTEVLRTCDELPDRCPRVVLAADYSDGADVLMAVPPLRSPADLRGRRVAVEDGTATMFLLSRALETAGLSFADVQVVQMPQADMADAVRAGRVDAVATYPPVALELARTGRLRTIFSSADIEGEVVDVVAVAPAWAEDRDEAVAALVRAWDRAVEYWRENAGEAEAVMAAREGVSTRAFAESLAHIRILRSAEQRFLFTQGGPLERAVAHHDRLLRRAGLIQGPDRSGQVIVGEYLQTALR
ncbi:ABC-type nitrate/sulfonate/bicarbonate transport system protein [Caenispirillum salinarum AK4]|uniref:ABC-type nitrate/sulfonate/bicarbonate transport system protein n=2 Tax=Caenispirillum TaxID=414051 RepID=K9HNA1_9PROT|nr:ABC-type nitrate/sulfonate/bicarbonate transport system protein [Caenispirillum salinarum AK4]